MIQVFEERRKPSIGQKLAGGLEKALPMVHQFQQEAEAKKLQSQERNALGQYLESLGVENARQFPPEAQQKIAQEFAKYGAKKSALGEFGFGNRENNRSQSTQNSFGNQFQGSEQDRTDNVNPKTGEVDVGNVNLQPLYSEDEIFNVSLIDNNAANQMRKSNDLQIEEARHQEKMEQKNREIALREKKESPAGKRETALATTQARADIDYNKQLQASAQQHAIKSETLNKLEKLNNKGVTGKPYEKLLERLGLVNLTSDGRREFAADVKHLITDIRSILGGQFSNFEFQTILNAYPSADFSQGANRAIINNLKEFQDIRHKEFEFANQIKKENNGKIPEDFQSLVNDRLQQYTESRLPDIKANTRKIMHEEYGIPEGNMLMFDPNGEPLNVSEELIDQYLELGATLP